MTQEITHGKIFFPGLCEFRPVPGYRCIEIQFSTGDQLMSADRHQALGRRIDIDEGVPGPWPGALFVPMTAPEIDYPTAVDHDGDRSANLAAVVEILRKRVSNPGEPGIALSFDPCTHRRLLDAQRPSGKRLTTGLSNTQNIGKKSSKRASASFNEMKFHWRMHVT